MDFYFVNSIVKLKRTDVFAHINKLVNTLSADLLSSVRNGGYNSKISTSLKAAKALVDGLKSTDAEYVYLAWKGSLLKTSAFFKNEPKVYTEDDLTLITARNITAVILCTESQTSVQYGVFKPNKEHTAITVEASPASDIPVYTSIVPMEKQIAPMNEISADGIVNTKERYQNTVSFMEKKAQEFTKGAAYADVCSCGRLIILTKNQLDWYKKRNFHMPKHCYFCKQKEKAETAKSEKAETDSPKKSEKVEKSE